MHSRHHPFFIGFFLAISLYFPNPCNAQYGEKYYQKNLPPLSSEELAIGTINTILERLPPLAQIAFRKRFLAISIQPPNKDDCNLPANLAGVRRFDAARNDDKDIVMFLCREQLTFTIESVTTLWLTLMTMQKLEAMPTQRIMEAATAKNADSAASLFNTFRKGGAAYLCAPAFRAYFLRREEPEAKCWGSDPEKIAKFMAPFFRSLSDSFVPELEKEKVSDVDLYFGNAEIFYTSIAKIVINFTLLHEIFHIINGDLDKESTADGYAELAADRFALQNIKKYTDEGDAAITGLTLIFAQIHMNGVNRAWLRRMENIRNTKLSDARQEIAMQASNCMLNELLKDENLPWQFKKYISELRMKEEYKCKLS